MYSQNSGVGMQEMQGENRTSTVMKMAKEATHGRLRVSRQIIAR